MIARVQDRLRTLLQHTATRLADAAGLPGVAVRDAEATPDAGSSRFNAQRLEGASATPPEEQDDQTEMSASVDTLAEQMLTLVDIVSAQEKDLKALREHCQRLDEHSQAIMVAFSAFFHVLSVGRVAKASEIASLLQSISKIAEQEGRPKESITFLQNLAGMVPGQSDSEVGP